MVKKLKIVDTSFNIGGPVSRKNVSLFLKFALFGS